MEPVQGAAGWKLSPHGQLESLPIPVGGLDALTRLLPAGGYTTFRTYEHSKALRLRAHFTRLEETARLINQPLALDRQRLRSALRRSLEDFSAGDMRVRILLDLTDAIGTLYFLVEPLVVPPEASYVNGVKAVTRALHRSNPKAKLSAFIETASDVRKTLPAGVNEALMIAEDNQVLEGLSSNFFAVWNGTIWTEEQRVLSGITRSMVLDAIHSEKIPLVLDGILLANLPEAQEAFITSASRAVLPVTQIDDWQVGDGRPGPLTLRLLADYRHMVQQDIEEI